MSKLLFQQPNSRFFPRAKASATSGSKWSTGLTLWRWSRWLHCSVAKVPHLNKWRNVQCSSNSSTSSPKSGQLTSQQVATTSIRSRDVSHLRLATRCGGCIVSSMRASDYASTADSSPSCVRGNVQDAGPSWGRLWSVFTCFMSRREEENFVTTRKPVKHEPFSESAWGSVD